MSDIRPILDTNKKFGDYLRLSWIFETWYEKLILVILCALGLTRIWGWIL